MSVPSFVDTNVLVYADDASETSKRERAQELIRNLFTERNGHLSLQVLQEYFSAATRKLGVPVEAARRKVELYAKLDVVPLGSVDVLGAIDLHRLHGLSIWDGLIIRAALISGCRRLYTEDLQSGFRIENLEVVNPFTRDDR